MKSFFISVICVGVLIGMSCKGKTPLNPLGCATNAQKLGEAAVKFSENPTPANCETYKKEVIAFFKSCPQYYSGVEKEDLEEFANSTCD